MSEKFGVENYKELVFLGAKTAIAVNAVTSDGLDLGDVDELYNVAMAIKPAIEDIGIVDDEILDMDETETKEVEDYLLELLDEMDFVVGDVKLAVKYFGNAGLNIAKGTLLILPKE